jgi:L-asparaginase
MKNNEHSGFGRLVIAGLLVSWAMGVSAAELPKVHVLATGGTIAGGATGPLTGADLVKRVPDLTRVAQVSVEDFSRIDSSRMTPELQHRLARRVNELFGSPEAPGGIVVTHGTDSLEETAFLLDLLVDSNRPVVFAAAQRPPTEADSDGPRNLLNAVRIAASPVARGMGVLVTLNGEIHAARDVRKMHAIALDAFKSPGAGGPLGYVDGSHVVITRGPGRRLTLRPGSVEPRVDLLTLVAGGDGHLIDAAAAGAQAMVLEVFGRGNVPPAVMEAVARARAKGVVVVFTTRTRGGRVELSEDARALGVMSGQDLDGLKARILLIAALGVTRDPVLLQSYFDRLSGTSP